MSGFAIVFRRYMEFVVFARARGGGLGDGDDQLEERKESSVELRVLEAASRVRCAWRTIALGSALDIVRRRKCDPSVDEPVDASLLIVLARCGLPQHLSGEVSGFGFFCHLRSDGNVSSSSTSLLRRRLLLLRVADGDEPDRVRTRVPSDVPFVFAGDSHCDLRVTVLK